MNRLSEEIAALGQKIEAEQETLAKKNAVLEEHRRAQEQFGAELTALTEKRDKAANRRKELWKEEAEQKATLEQLKDCARPLSCRALPILFAVRSLIAFQLS